MYLRTAAIFIGLLAATTLAFVQNSNARKAPAAVSAAHKPPAKTHVATAPVAAPQHEAIARRGRGVNEPRKHGKPETGAVGTEEAPPGPVTFPDSVGWLLIVDPATGARFGLPGKLVPRVEPSRTGSRYRTAFAGSARAGWC